MVALEWGYLPVLDSRDIRPSTLIVDVLDNHASFVQLLRLAYKPSITLEEPDLDVPQRSILATRAYSLLKCLDRLPGQTDMSFDKDKLIEWIDAARHESVFKRQLYCWSTIEWQLAMRWISELQKAMIRNG